MMFSGTLSKIDIDIRQALVWFVSLSPHEEYVPRIILPLLKQMRQRTLGGDVSRR